MEVRQTPREFLADFIELYRSFVCLWQVKNEEYNNRTKKDYAYSVLVRKYQEFDPSADRTTVVKKINALRTVYKKELTKVNNSVLSGVEYKPNLWYFDLLHFLNHQDSPRARVSIKQEVDQQIQQDEPEQLDIKPVTPDYFQQTDLVTPGNHASSTPRSATPPTIGQRTKRRKNSEPTPADEVIQLAGDQLKAVCPGDEFEAFGKYVAIKLRSLKGNQGVVARKLINDVIFEGELGTLTRDSKVIAVQNSGHS